MKNYFKNESIKYFNNFVILSCKMNKRKKRKYPLLSSPSQLRWSKKKSKNTLRSFMSIGQINTLKKIERQFLVGDDSLKKYKKNKKRKILYKKIIKKQFSNKNTIDRKDPDLYVFGGLPASGKSRTLRRKVPEKTIIIDNDDYKRKLVQKDKSPLVGYPLAHAGYFHRESDILVEQAIKKSIKEKRDVTIDVTFASYDKNINLINKFKKAGYDVHLLGTQQYPHKAVVGVVHRFKRKGRYVPPSYVAKKGNKMNRNVWKARKETDTHRIYNTEDFDNIKLASKSEKGMEHNFRDPK